LWCRRRASLNAMNEKKPLDMSGFFNLKTAVSPLRLQ
jgi:hypothetical protein